LYSKNLNYSKNFSLDNPDKFSIIDLNFNIPFKQLLMLSNWY